MSTALRRSRLTVFGPYRLDVAGGRLWRGDRPVVLRAKTWQVLCLLVERAGELVTVDEIMDAVWAGVTVGPSVLTNVIGELRRALDDRAGAPRWIETVHRRGYRFLGAESDDVAREPASDAPARIFVGRDAELAELARLWDDACHGRRRMVFVAGEAGLGKTTLIDAFATRLARDPQGRVAGAQCIDQHGAGEPYMPVLDLLDRLGGGDDRAAFVDVLRHHAPTWLAQISSLLPADEMQRLRQSLLGTDPQRMLREGVALLEALAARGPIALVLENVHWADRPTLDLVNALAQRADAAALLIVLTYRPAEAVARSHPVAQLVHQLRLHRRARLLSLAPFGPKDVHAYLDRRVPGQAATALAALAEEQSAGNPLFLGALVTHLIERGELQSHDGNWTLAAARREVEWPDDLRATIDAELGLLPAPVLELLQAASVEGDEFSLQGVAAATGAAVEDIEDRLHEVATRWQLTTPIDARALAEGADTRYRFKHALYRHAAYARIPPSRRRRLHQRVGERIELVWGDRAGEVASQLLTHFEAADDVERRVRYARLAGDTAAARFVPLDAAAHYRDAVAQLRRLPATPERLREIAVLELASGNMRGFAGTFLDPEVRDAYARAEAAARAGGAHRERFRALFGLCTCHVATGDPRPLAPLVQQQLEMTTTVVPGLAAQAHWRAGEMHLLRGELDDARVHLEASLAADAEPGIPVLTDVRCSAGAGLAITLTLLGRFHDARVALDRALARSEALGLPFNLCYTAWFAVIVHTLQRDEAQRMAAAARITELAAQFAISSYQGTDIWSSSNAGDHLDDLFRIEAATRGTRGRSFEPAILGRIAAACVAAGDVARARHWATAGLREAAGMGQHWYDAELHRLAGDACRAGGGDPADAEAAFRRAIDVARGQGARLWHLRAATSLAHLLYARGDATAARALLDDAGAGLSTEDAVDVQEAQALRATLS